MRVELVIELPDIHNPDAVDAVTIGLEAVRLLSNDTGTPAELIHAAVGTAISVPRDFDEEHPVLSVEPTDIVHAPSASSPHNEDRDSNVTSPYVTVEHVAAREAEEQAITEAQVEGEDGEPFAFTPTEHDEDQAPEVE